MLDNACKLAKTDVNLLFNKLLTKLFLYEHHTFDDKLNQLILQGTITFIRLSEQFKIGDLSPSFIHNGYLVFTNYNNSQKTFWSLSWSA